jgi:hypothetical protein
MPASAGLETTGAATAKRAAAATDVFRVVLIDIFISFLQVIKRDFPLETRPLLEHGFIAFN